MSENTNVWAEKFSILSILGAGNLGRGFSTTVAREFPDLAIRLVTSDPKGARRTLGTLPSNLVVSGHEDGLSPDGPLFVCTSFIDEIRPEMLSNRPVVVLTHPVELICERLARLAPQASILGFGVHIEKLRMIEALSFGFGIEMYELLALPVTGYSYSNIIPALSAIAGLESEILGTPVDEFMTGLRGYQSFYSLSPETVAASAAVEFTRLYTANPGISELRRAHLLIRSATHAIQKNEFPANRTIDGLISLVGAMRSRGWIEASARLTPSSSFCGGLFDFAHGELRAPALTVTERAMLAEETLRHRASLSQLERGRTATLETAL